MNHQNVVPKKIDPLDLELRFFDDFNNPITDSIILTSVPSQKRKRGRFLELRQTLKNKDSTKSKATMVTKDLLRNASHIYSEELQKINIQEDDSGIVPARMSLKILRNKGIYLNAFKDEGFFSLEELDDYYFVEDGDPLREIFLDLERKQKETPALLKIHREFVIRI